MMFSLLFSEVNTIDLIVSWIRESATVGVLLGDLSFSNRWIFSLMNRYPLGCRMLAEQRKQSSRVLWVGLVSRRVVVYDDKSSLNTPCIQMQ